MVELAIYLQFVILEIRNVDVVAKLGILLRCVIHKKLLVTSNSEITVADHVNNLHNTQTLNKLDMLMEKHLLMSHRIAVNRVTIIKAGNSINVELKINNTEVVMELDTGASLTIMSEKTLQHKLPHLELKPSAVILKTYSGSN